MMTADKQTSEGRPVERIVTIVNKLGMHARPAALFVRKANEFECEIEVEKDGERVNGKSIMGLMMLAAGQGTSLRILAKGREASVALDALEELVRAVLGED